MGLWQKGKGTERLTPKREKFVQEYLVDLNAAQAAIRAGYSAKTARSIGQRLLTNVDIQSAIERRRLELREATQVTQERVVQELALVAFCRSGTLPEEDGQDGGMEVKTSDKVRALESLGKHLGLFVDKVEHEGEIQIRLAPEMEDVAG